MAKKETLVKLAANAANPRVITDGKRAKLQRDLAKFGDIGGVVFNVTSGQIVGGHQRTEIFREGKGSIEIITRYHTPTSQGTMAEGYITWKNSRYAYREVAWDEAMERAANILANTHAGEWDYNLLGSNYEAAELKDFGLSINFAPPDPIETPGPIVKRDAPKPGGGVDPGGSDDDDDGGEEEEPGGPPPPPSVNTGQGVLFPITTTVNKAQHLEWSAVKDKLGKRRDGEAFVALLDLLKDGGIDKLL